MIKVATITGAQGVGKTTLCLAVEAAEPASVTFYPTNVSKVADNLEINVKDAGSVERRMELQDALLLKFKHHIIRLKERMAEMGDHWLLLDRGFVDLIAYALIDPYIQASNDPKVQEWVENYIESCLVYQLDLIDLHVMVQPGIAIQEAEGKQSYFRNVASQTLFNNLIKGIYSGEVFSSNGVRPMLFPENMTNLEERVAAMKRCFKVAELNVGHIRDARAHAISASH